MARGPERKIEDWFVAGMTRHRYMNLKGDAAAEKFGGWSDRIFFGYGPRTVIVEFKRDDAPTRRRGEKRQDYMREQLRRRKYEVYKVRGWAQAYKVFALITGEVYAGGGQMSKVQGRKVRGGARHAPRRQGLRHQLRHGRGAVSDVRRKGRNRRGGRGTVPQGKRSRAVP